MIDVLIILKGHTQRRDYLIWHFVLRLSRIWSKVLTLKCHWAQWAEYIWIFNSEYHTVEATLFNWRAVPFADQKSGSASSTLKWSPHLAAARGSHFKKAILNGWFHCGFEVNFPRSSYQSNWKAKERCVREGGEWLWCCNLRANTCKPIDGSQIALFSKGYCIRSLEMVISLNKTKYIFM